MDDTRHVRLFRNGRNQAVRIPRDMELPGDEALLSREGDTLVLRPMPPSSLLGMLRQLDPLDEALAWPAPTQRQEPR